MHRSVRFVAGSLAALLAIASSGVFAGNAPVFGYGAMFSNASQRYSLVSFPLIAPIAPLDGQVLDATPANSRYTELYAIDADSNLVTIDTATGAESVIGPLGVQASQRRVSLAADPGTGALFAVIGDYDCLFTVLYSIDATTGAATPVTPLGECVASVAADVPNQLLYFLDRGAGALNVVDAQGNETTLGPLGIVMNETAHLAIDPVSGGLFLTIFEFPSFANSLYSIDTTTGAGTFLQSLGGENPLAATVLAPPPGTVIDPIFANGFDA